MSNEEQVADTIEMLYERLNSYNKQDLFNYGYLLESNEILCKDIEEKDKEIERLKEQLNDEIDDELKQSEIMVKQQNEIERQKEIIRQLDIKNLELTTIINKLEEYMRSDDGWDVENILNYLQELKDVYLDCKLYETKVYEDILEILDKENI